MNYNTVSRGLKSGFADVLSGTSSINSLSLNCSGDAFSALTDDFSTALQNISRQESNIEILSDALGKLEEYKQAKVKLEQLRDSYNQIPDSDEGERLKVEVFRKIAMTETRIKNLKITINGKLSEIKSVKNQFKEITYHVSDNNSYKEFIA